MRQLDEQWIEELDGVRRMVKLCESNYKEIGTCGGCIYHRWDEGDWCDVAPLKACVEFGYIVKDLGPVNEDGCLPSPWGGYPKIVRVGREGFCTYKVRFYLKHGRVYGFTLIEVTGNTRQEAIDAWNRRT